MLLRADQEVTVTLVLREVRRGASRVPCWSVRQWTAVGTMERVNRTSGELLQTTKHATETKIGGRLDTDHPLISWMVRHSCWLHCRFHVGPDGRRPHEVLRNNSQIGGLAFLGDIVWARVLGTSF